MEKQFDKILDNDEKVVKVIKPNKFKYYMSFFVKSTLCTVWFAIIGVFAILFPDEGITVTNKVMAIWPVVAYVVLELIIMVFALFYYDATYYAYTNKRLIIRSGIFGVDYRSLDMDMVGAIDVYVSLLDKMTGKDTGAVCFGSTASPMISMYGGSYYRFNHIDKPYETCKEIKLAIDNYKSQVKGTKELVEQSPVETQLDIPATVEVKEEPKEGVKEEPVNNVNENEAKSEELQAVEVSAEEQLVEETTETKENENLDNKTEE
ncbi:MAG: PH domain-containing protein [Clostridia bacterium]|nr:PH domain-containing protein [Clostridia bacterium]